MIFLWVRRGIAAIVCDILRNILRQGAGALFASGAFKKAPESNFWQNALEAALGEISVQKKADFPNSGIAFGAVGSRSLLVKVTEVRGRQKIGPFVSEVSPSLSQWN